MTSWDEVGGNPCPGDVGALRAHIAVFRTISEHGKDLENKLTDLHAGIGTIRWTGAGAMNIAGLVQNSVPDLAKFWTAHDDAARALTTYADHLEDLQAQAKSALNDYSTAASDRKSAESAVSDATSRRGAANDQVGRLDHQIRELTAQRSMLAASHQPVSSIDADLSQLSASRHYQAALTSAAHDDLAAASTRVEDAESRMAAAKRMLGQYRDELDAYASTASTAILGAVGIVHSSNPLVRIFGDVVHGVNAGAAWLSDNMLDELDHLSGELTLAGVVCAIVPGLQPLAPFLLGAGEALAVVSFIGHFYRFANGQEGWGDLAWSGFAALPLSRALGGLVKDSKADVESFEKLSSIAKRLTKYEYPNRLHGLFSPRGFDVMGKTIRIRAVPALKGSKLVGEGLLYTKAAQLAKDYYDGGRAAIQDVVDFTRSDAPAQPVAPPAWHRTPVPVTHLQLRIPATSPAKLAF